MKFEVIIAIAVGAYVLRTWIRNMAKQREKVQRGGQISNNPAQGPQNFETQMTDMRQAEGHSLEGRSMERQMADRVREERTSVSFNPFELPTSLEQRTGHYDEQQLVTEYEETHSRGRSVSHHKHQLFDGDRDRQKAVRHNAKRGAQSKGSAATKAGGAAAKGAAATKGAAKLNPRQTRLEAQAHPIAALMNQKAGLKQAFIMSELLARPVSERQG